MNDAVWRMDATLYLYVPMSQPTKNRVSYLMGIN